MVKNPPANAGDTGLNPGPGIRALLATEQQSPCATTTEPELQYRSHNYGSPRALQPALHKKTHCNVSPGPTIKSNPARCNFIACSNEDPAQPQINS